MSDLSQALEDAVKLFDELNVSYVIMGGIAVRVYGIPRPTYDVDFTAAIPRTMLPTFYRAVEELGYSVPEQYQQGWVDDVAGMPLVKFRLYVGPRGVDIDVFLAEAPFQQALLARRRREDLDGIPVWLVSPEDLILLKLMAYRPRDIADIGDILFTQGQLDEPYLRQWAGQLGFLDRLEKALRESSDL